MIISNVFCFGFNPQIKKACKYPYKFQIKPINLQDTRSKHLRSSMLALTWHVSRGTVTGGLVSSEWWMQRILSRTSQRLFCHTLRILPINELRIFLYKGKHSIISLNILYHNWVLKITYKYWDKIHFMNNNISTFRFFVQITNLVCAMNFVTLLLMQRIPWWCYSNLEKLCFCLKNTCSCVWNDILHIIITSKNKD